MKKIKLYVMAGLSALVLTQSACSNFDEINTNPNSTTTASASLLCTGNILSIFKFTGDTKAYISSNALPKYVGYANEGQLGPQYNVIGAGSFGSMTRLPDIEQMVEYAKGTAMESSYRGVAKFVRAYMFYSMTMQMGDIPYSETNRGLEGYYTPKYDLQEDVLQGILDELKEADEYFAQGVTFTGDPTPYDGDPKKWRRATNAFALRVLMSLSKRADDSKINVKQRFADIVAQNQLMEASTGYLGLIYSSKNRYPLYGTNDTFTARTILSSLVVNYLKKLSDRRLFYYAEPAAAQTRAGLQANDPEAYVGVDVDMVYADMNKGHTAGQYSIINLRYQKEETGEPRMFVTYAEQQLIIAEACLRGWVSGSAKDYYESGVKAALMDVSENAAASYAHGMAIDAAYIDSYFTGEAAFKSAKDDQLKQVWLQRYLLGFLQTPTNAFYEYRRTTYPEFPINPNTNLNPEPGNEDKIPMRWTYPTSEANYNQENLDEALNRQYGGYNEVNQLMWLLK